SDRTRIRQWVGQRNRSWLIPSTPLVGFEQLIGALGSPTTGGVLGNRDGGIVVPRIQNSLHELPRLLDELAAGKQGMVTFQHIDQEALGGIWRVLAERGCVAQVHSDRLEVYVEAGLLGHHVEREALVRLDAEGEEIGGERPGAVKQNLRDVFELNED